MDGKVTRRGMFRASAVLVGAAAGILGATDKAQAKVAKTIVAYQDSPKGNQRCDNCKLFEPPNACKSVEGPISPAGWCKMWIKA